MSLHRWCCCSQPTRERSELGAENSKYNLEGYSPKAKHLPKSVTEKNSTFSRDSTNADVIETEFEVGGSKPAFEVLERNTKCRLLSFVKTQSLFGDHTFKIRQKKNKDHFSTSSISSHPIPSQQSILSPNRRNPLTPASLKNQKNVDKKINLRKPQSRSDSRITEMRLKLLGRKVDNFEMPDPKNPFVFKKNEVKDDDTFFLRPSVKSVTLFGDIGSKVQRRLQTPMFDRKIRLVRTEKPQ